jgi:E-phenylitaconyl-CoA hydratase
MALVELRREDSIGFITLNRPEALNAINIEMWEDLKRIWDDFRRDPELRVAIVSGAGEKAFCTGLDLKDFVSHGDPRVRDFWNAEDPADLGRGPRIWKPMIAAVQGFCLAGGFEIALACDIRVAADNASFGLPEIRRGFFPGTGGTIRLPRLIPEGIALEMLYTGESISAQEAHRIGLVNRVVPHGELLPAVTTLARKIAAGPPVALRAIKEVVLRSREMPFTEAIRLEAGFRALVGHTEDAREGPRAFAEKRSPKFTGR